MASENSIYLSDILNRELVKEWNQEEGVQVYVIETTAKSPKFLPSKIVKLSSKAEFIREQVNHGSNVVTIMINSNNISKLRANKLRSNKSYGVDYLLATELVDDNNGHYHKLGGHKFEDYMSDTLENIVGNLKLTDNYILEKRIYSPPGEIDILFLTSKKKSKYEKKIIKELKTSNHFKLYGDRIN